MLPLQSLVGEPLGLRDVGKVSSKRSNSCTLRDACSFRCLKNLKAWDRMEMSLSFESELKEGLENMPNMPVCLFTIRSNNTCGDSELAFVYMLTDRNNAMRNTRTPRRFSLRRISCPRLLVDSRRGETPVL